MSDSEAQQAEPYLKSHRKPGVRTRVVRVGDTKFGDGSFPVLAGPAAVESEEQIVATAEAVSAAGGLVLRSAAFLPRDLAGDFAPLGAQALWLLEHASRASGLSTATFVFEREQAELAANHVDLLEVGPSRMSNRPLLEAAGSSGKPVVIHRGPESTVDEWLSAADIVRSAGSDVMLCERGSAGHDPRTAGTLDISAVAVVQQLSDHPVLVNPAPLVGSLDLIAPLALAARGAGADGVMVAVHPYPTQALFRAGGHLDLGTFAELMDQLGIPSLRDDIDRIDRELLKLMSRRLSNSIEIGRMKTAKNLPLESPDREAELIDEARADAVEVGLDPDYIEDVMRIVLRHSKIAQKRAAGGDLP